MSSTQWLQIIKNTNTEWHKKIYCINLPSGIFPDVNVANSLRSSLDLLVLISNEWEQLVWDEKVVGPAGLLIKALL